MCKNAAAAFTNRRAVWHTRSKAFAEFIFVRFSGQGARQTENGRAAAPEIEPKTGKEWWRLTLLQRVEELTFEYGNDSKRQIGEFILQKKSRLREYSLQQIAQETYTSKAAAVRFAKALGYSGWREFVRAFVSEQHYEQEHYSEIDPNFPFGAGDTTKDILQKMSSLEVESILDTADQLLPQTVDAAAQLLARARRVALFGNNPNYMLGELFRRRMLTIGRQVELPVGEDKGLLASSLGPEDCAVVISYSGTRTKNSTMEILPFLQAGGVPIIALTSAGENELRAAAACTFTISSRERLYSKISTFATEASIQYILNVLFSAYFALDYDDNLARKLGKARALENTRRSPNADLQEPEQAGK
jgi:DNA-binding MurR/RpiR family transcriptional regulator